MSKLQSPRILTRGLWVTTVNSSHPSVNMRHFARAYVIASASPSTGAYLESASMVKRDPANMSFHSVGQQLGASFIEHWQCFWSRANPRPHLQPIRCQDCMAVGFKAFHSWLYHLHDGLLALFKYVVQGFIPVPVPGLRRSRNGCICNSIHQSEPGTSVSYVSRCGKFQDCIVMLLMV